MTEEDWPTCTNPQIKLMFRQGTRTYSRNASALDQRADELVMSMTRRRWLIFLGALFAAVAGVVVSLLIPPKPGVTRENFRRLHMGMTKAEVVENLGCEEDIICLREDPPYMWRVRWTDGETRVVILFVQQISSTDAAVKMKAVRGVCCSGAETELPLSGKSETLVENLRRRLKETTGL